MNSDKVRDQSFLDLVNEYFPRDAVQVMEDIRVAHHQLLPGADLEANLLLGSLSGRTAK
jgi:hypothetical protein